jgi:glycosyltransferase involved in cell wall biosynthesis
MTDSPLISVLMPVHNAERFVAEAVESILAQTFSDFELLIVDDGSTDGSRAILERLAALDGRIRLVSRTNRGLVATLNELLGMARGDLVARMDADDVALPGRFALQVAFLGGHPEVVCVGGQVQETDVTGRWDLVGPVHPTDHETMLDQMLRGIPAINHPSVMMRLAALREVGGYDEEFEQSEDLDLWLRLAERGRLANLGEVILRYRIHPGSKTEMLHTEQDRFARLASDRACRRRGLEPRFQSLGSYRPGKSRKSRSDSLLGYGWVGFMRGDRRMAMHFGLKALRALPVSPGPWRLLACTVLKPIRKEIP